MKIGNTIRAIRSCCAEIQWVEKMLLIWIPTHYITEFLEKSGLKNYDNNTGGIECKIQPWVNKVCFDVVPVCEYFGIDPEELLPKGGNQ